MQRARYPGPEGPGLRSPKPGQDADARLYPSRRRRRSLRRSASVVPPHIPNLSWRPASKQSLRTVHCAQIALATCAVSFPPVSGKNTEASIPRHAASPLHPIMVDSIPYKMAAEGLFPHIGCRESAYGAPPPTNPVLYTGTICTSSPVSGACISSPEPMYMAT